MMMALVALMTSAYCLAEDYTTAGDGTTWTMTKLSETEGSGVTKDGTTFTMANNVLVAKGDAFQIEGGITVQLAKGVSLEIEGSAMMVAPADQRVLITRSAEGVVPGLFYMRNDEEVTTFRNIDFEYVGLKNFAEKGLVVDSCTFRHHAASTTNGSSAVNMGSTGAEFVITNCIFEQNDRSAIGGAANYSNPVRIENCQFLNNGTNNRLYPQINLTAASQVVIRHCVIIGNREKYRVGGIAVSDNLGVVTDANLLIENCFVRDASYGIAVYSGQKAVVRNNVLMNNDVIADANQGGSGINIYDTTGKQNTTITGNFITGNLWGVTVIATKAGTVANLGRIDVNPSSEDYNIGQNVFLNNGNADTVYDLYNNSANTVYAQNNGWLTVASFDSEAIGSCIFDKNDNESLGEVIYKTTAATPDPSGIPAIQFPMSGIQAIYNLNGIQTKEMQKGLNIVVQDGKAHKVVK